jgi:hypothetical protein
MRRVPRNDRAGRRGNAATTPKRTRPRAGAIFFGVDLGTLEPVPLVAGMTDTWQRGPDSLVAVYRGEADSDGESRFLRAHLCEGLPEHAFWFD